MALYSKNPGHWRTSRTGSLNAHHSTVERAHSGRPIDGRLLLEDVPAKGIHRRKRHTAPTQNRKAKKRHTLKGRLAI
jgi:hypothetical protein